MLLNLCVCFTYNIFVCLIPYVCMSLCICLCSCVCICLCSCVCICMCKLVCICICVGTCVCQPMLKRVDKELCWGLTLQSICSGNRACTQLNWIFSLRNIKSFDKCQFKSPLEYRQIWGGGEMKFTKKVTDRDKLS